MSNEFKYTIKYKNRKTVSISIDSEGSIIISVPIGFTDRQVENIINKKEAWILKKLDELSKREKLFSNEILFLGEKYLFKVVEQKFVKRNFVVFHNDVFIVTVKERSQVSKTLELWFRAKTEELVTDKVSKFQEYFDTLPKDIIIKEQRRRWGSCSYDNRIFLNWRLSMAKEKALEYVIVHEMCHMIHKNHSSKFWDEVKRVMPDYKEASKWLEENGYLLFKL